MKVIYHTNSDIKPEKNTKHVINFFGVLGCIKVNTRSKNPPKEQESKLVDSCNNVAINFGPLFHCV